MRLPLIRNKLIWLLIPFATACHNHTAYHSYRPISQEGWGKGDTLVYLLPDSFATGKYRLEIGIRYLDSYPYRDLWLEVSQNLEEAGRYATDTLHLFLTDEAGNKTQNSPGGLYQYTTEYPTDLTLPANDTVRSFRILHLMKDQPLKGITDIGIRLAQPTAAD